MPEHDKTAREKAHYETMLWQKAGELDTERKALKEEGERLFAEVQGARRHQFNLHQEEIRGKENNYWQIQKELEAVGKIENEIQLILEELGSGKMDVQRIQNAIGNVASSGEERKVSKRKRAVEAERARVAAGTGFGADLLMSDARGPASTHLTTGRHATAVKGNLQTATAADDFFYQTADTHGGKIRKPGKKGGTGSSWARQHLIDPPSPKGKGKK